MADCEAAGAKKSAGRLQKRSKKGDIMGVYSVSPNESGRQ
jgi:hypothetical protein